MKYKLRNTYSQDPSEALRDILWSRGVEDVEDFYYPSLDQELDPHLLNNIELAANKLLEHLNKNSHILFIVDADCDGFTSSAILWLYIKRHFPSANLDFTVHEHKQHGMDDKIDWILTQTYHLVLAPDSSSYDVEEHKRLADAGIDCICLDHHEQEYDEERQPVISHNAIVVNNQLSPQYQNKSLCGAGVVYKFCEILDELLESNYAQDYLDLVALGEIADVMDRRTSETNSLIMLGLKNIKNQGFKTLIESQSFSLKEKASPPYEGLTPIDIAFYIAPLINSITRVGTIEEKETMFYCFIEPERIVPSTKRGARDGDTERADEQTARIGKNAKARQDKLKERAVEIMDFKIQKEGLQNNNIIIAEIEPEDKIPSELGGLVAMAIVNKYNRPCLMVRDNGDGLLQGSARSNNNFSALPNLKAYEEASGFFSYVAGHDGAHGVGIERKNLEKFIDYVNKDLPADAFENCYNVDYVLDARNSIQLLIATLGGHPEFFGNGVDEIRLIIKNISIKNYMLMGANKDSIKISFNGIDYVHFKDADFIQEIINNQNKTLTIYTRPNLNTWGGRTTIQCFIDDYCFENNDSKYDF